MSPVIKIWAVFRGGQGGFLLPLSFLSPFMLPEDGIKQNAGLDNQVSDVIHFICDGAAKVGNK